MGNVAIRFSWGDGDTSNWSSFVVNGQSISANHTWNSPGNYSIRAQAKDEAEDTSDWSVAHNISIWPKTFGGAGYDEGNSVQQTSDGGYIIVGRTTSFGAGNQDVYLIKTDASGNAVWTKTFGGTNDDGGYSVRQTSDGGYIIAGFTKSFGAGNQDVYLIKTDASGNSVWTKTYGETNNDNGNSVQQTSDGGYIITGTYGSSGANADVYLIKTNANGNGVWIRTFGGAGYGNDYGFSVQQTSDGGYIIAGATLTENGGIFKNSVYLIKTNASGNSVWEKTIGGTQDDYGYSVQQTSDGGYIVAGYTYSYGVGSGDVYLIKTDANGNTTWTKTFGGTDLDGGCSVRQTSDGGYIVAGFTQSFGAGSYDVYLIKTNANGNSTWTRTIGGANNDCGYSVQQTSDGGYIIAGYTGSYGAGGFDVYLVKTDVNGNTK
jgi:hypothetical protein